MGVQTTELAELQYPCPRCGHEGQPVLFSGNDASNLVMSIGCQTCGHAWDIKGAQASQRRSHEMHVRIEQALQHALHKARETLPMCPGYGAEASCTARATTFQYLIDDPTAYCERHAKAAAAFWDCHGFPPASYIRLADGTALTSPPTKRRR